MTDKIATGPDGWSGDKSYRSFESSSIYGVRKNARITPRQLGQKLQRVRWDADKSQTEVETATDLSRNTLSNIENGRFFPHIDVLIRLCDHYGITPNDILGYSDTLSKAEYKPVATTDPPSVEEMSGRLKRARLNAGLTQRTAADAANIGESTVYNSERGRSYPTLEVLMRLCSVYRVNIADIVYKEDA